MRSHTIVTFLVIYTSLFIHDGKHPYEITAGSEIVIDYSAHRKAQMIAIVLAGLMLAMAFLVWRRK